MSRTHTWTTLELDAIRIEIRYFDAFVPSGEARWLSWLLVSLDYRMGGTTPVLGIVWGVKWYLFGETIGLKYAFLLGYWGQLWAGQPLKFTFQNSSQALVKLASIMWVLDPFCFIFKPGSTLHMILSGIVEGHLPLSKQEQPLCRRKGAWMLMQLPPGGWQP